MAQIIKTALVDGKLRPVREYLALAVVDGRLLVRNGRFVIVTRQEVA